MSPRARDLTNNFTLDEDILDVVEEDFEGGKLCSEFLNDEGLGEAAADEAVDS